MEERFPQVCIVYFETFRYNNETVLQSVFIFLADLKRPVGAAAKR
jgi:hypothetical protein